MTDIEDGEQAGEEPLANSEAQLDTDTWVMRHQVQFTSAGKAAFDGLPADRDLRLVLYRRGDELRSQVLRLAPDRTAVVRFRLPDRRTPEEIEGDPHWEFNASVTQLPPPPDAKVPGFTWE